MPFSSPKGKSETIAWIRKNLPPTASILDVGPGAGTYARMLKMPDGSAHGLEESVLPRYENIDCVEIWAPYIEQFHLYSFYKEIHICDIRLFRYHKEYDLVIFGDVLEHLSVVDAATALYNASLKSKNIIVSVPWNYEQGPIEANVYEAHLQWDLTPEVFNERYPGGESIFLDNEMGVYAFS